MSTASTIEVIDDPRELLYLHRRRKVRRRQMGLVLALLALVLGYFGWRVGSHLLAARWLETNQFTVVWGVDKTDWKQGGTTTVRFGKGNGFFFGGVSFSVSRDNGDLKFLTWLNHVEELDLSYSPNLRDRDLANLDRLTDLRHLDLDRTRPQAWSLNDHGRLTDATLTRIKRLKRLEQLNIGGQQITDAGLTYLAGLDQLRALDIRGTGITDAGLEHLKALPRLKSLDLSRTRVTFQGVRNFETACPRVTVLSDALPPASRPRQATNPQRKP